MAESTRSNSVFTSYQVDRLAQIGKFILRVGDTDIAVDAVKLGYDGEEHAEGVTNYSIAAGLKIPFNHHLSSIMLELLGSGSEVTKNKIREVDKFENRWHPRARNAIRRFIARTEREAFESAFFLDMPQQQEGPLVIDSVKKLISRLEDMKQSPVEGAAAAYASLVKKGLTTEEIDRVKLLLTELDSRPPVTPPEAPISEEQLAQLAQDRLEAYEQLNLWYIDWAEMFRDELNYSQLRRLGLVSHGDGAAEPKTPTEPEPSSA